MNKLKRIILDAMKPAFKAANAELLKAIKMNDKTDAVLYTDLEAINKAMKANDGEKVGAGLKKVQLKFKDAEKKLNEDLKDVTQRFSEAQKEVDSVKEKSKQIKSVQQLFDKAKSLVNSLKTSPKNASKLTTTTDKLKQYGDLSGKAQKVIQLISSGKDASKQIDILAKAVLAAEKKFKKESSSFDKEFNKSRDAYIVLKERLKICKDKLAAFQKERLYIANVVKMMPQGELRQKRETKGENQIQEIVNEGNKLYNEARAYALKVASRYEDYKTFLSDYEKQCKKLVWSAYENTPLNFGSSKIKSAYKYTSFYQLKELVSTLNEVAKNIISSGDNPKKYLGKIGDFIRTSESEYTSKFQRYKTGSTENNEWAINNDIESGNERNAIVFILDNIEPFKTKFKSLSEQFAANKGAAKSACLSKLSLLRNLGK